MDERGSIRVNGATLPHGGLTIEELLRELQRDPSAPGIAVAVRGEVVPRREWSSRRLLPGDDVELVGAAQGG